MAESEEDIHGQVACPSLKVREGFLKEGTAQLRPKG